MTAPVQEGDVLLGKYRVERVLGVGGMGVVVAATHLQLDQRVALKFMLPEVLTNKDLVTRFLREARAVVRLKGEHVARVLDVGTLDNGAPYIVMEYLDGDDLAATLSKRGPLPIAEAASYVVQACEAMAEAHALGIVHRDLKPQNLFLTRRPDGSPFVKVLDFGIAKTAQADATDNFQATQTSAVMGSPAYMSPEQIKSSKDVDGRSDIWALGVILYQLVSGKIPFNAPTAVELCIQVLHTAPPPLRSIRPDVPVELEALIARCLCKERDERYANVAELVADLAPFVPRIGAETLERIARLLSVTPRVTSPGTVPGLPSVAPGLATTLGSAVGVSVTASRPARWRWAAIGIGAVVVVLGVGFAMTRREHGAAGSPTDPVGSAAQVEHAVVVPPLDAGSAVVPVVLDAAPIAVVPPPTVVDAGTAAAKVPRPTPGGGRVPVTVPVVAVPVPVPVVDAGAPTTIPPTPTPTPGSGIPPTTIRTRTGTEVLGRTST